MAGPKKSPPPSSSPPSPSRSPAVSLQPSSPRKNPSKSTKILRRVRSVFRSFPIITPAACKFPGSLHTQHDHHHIHGGTRMTGTLFGYRKTRINLAIQENPRCLPVLLLGLSIPTGKLLQEMGLGLVRIAMECDKRGGKTKLVDEPIWTMYCNGKKMGYGVKREPTDDDLYVMEMLHAISMGAGVLSNAGGDSNSSSSNNNNNSDDVVDINSGAGTGTDGELTYMRAHFERVIRSKDSETYYMMNPDGNSGPELSIFFVRV
ncbi:protein MIZU-KUSSEI 1-like [Bidens hawaiensis]|uniref:protein MIZU-KUSSEI 1-like n=1 Tax=Bidens hawaiensis TaxID=980011 RepID=UPI0040491BA5